MRKGNSGEENGGKRLMRIVATTSLPAVDRPNTGTPHARAKNERTFKMKLRKKESLKQTRRGQKGMKNQQYPTCKN